METLNNSKKSNNATGIENDRDGRPRRKHQKTKGKRRGSIGSVKDNQQIQNNKTSKWKSSLAQIKQEISESRQFRSKESCQSIDNDRLSTLQWLKQEHNEKNPTDIPNIMQITIDDKKDIQSVETKSEEIYLEKDNQRDNSIKTSNEERIDDENCITKEIEETNVDLEEKLDQDDQLNSYTTLDLSSSNITDKDIRLIIKRAFKEEKKKYTNLVLRDNALTSEGIKILVDQLLSTPTSLKNLGLSSNPFLGDAGIQHLIRLLEGDKSITLLALHNTGITDRGLRLLADVLCNTNNKSGCVLEKLYISFNKAITDQSLETFIQIIEQNQTLKILALQNCSLSDKARQRLRQITTKKKKKKFILSD